MERILACATLTALLIPAWSQAQNQHRSIPSVQPPAPASDSSKSAALAALDERVKALENKLAVYQYLLDQKQQKYESIQLDPSSRAFQRLDSDTSDFLVSVADATPFLTGYRITLKIGNPVSADFANAKVKIRWARSYDFAKYSEDSYKQWQSTIREKEISLTESLKGGAWNTVTVDLVPCAPDEMGYLQMSLETPSVLLRTQ